MKSKTILGADGTTEMREITVGIHGKGGEVGIRAVQRIAGMVSSLKQCKTPQEVYDRYLQITGYCKCCIDCGFMDEKGADVRARFYRDELREIQKKLQRAGIETRQVFWSEKERRSYYWKNGAPERCKNPDCKNCPFPPCRKGEANNE